jgi:hypothetical protein
LFTSFFCFFHLAAQYFDCKNLSPSPKAYRIESKDDDARRSFGGFSLVQSSGFKDM